MGTSTEERLHVAAWAFHDAVQRRDGLQARLRRGELDPELQERCAAATESVALARLGLYRLLVSEGWAPPPVVVRELELAASLLEPPG